MAKDEHKHEAGQRCNACPFPIGGFQEMSLGELKGYEAGELTMTLRLSVLTGTIEGQEMAYDVAMNGDIWITIGKPSVRISARELIEMVYVRLRDGAKREGS